ncbi:MAG: tetratricopeptide repeat protein [Chlorobi bacterium]|nr:tetratricopeptide repeat protein [Chlorobiota bacterium]
MMKTVYIFLIFILSFLSLNAQQAENIYQKAYAEYLIGHFDKAYSVLNKETLPVYGKDKYLMLKGDILFAKNKFDDALTCYKEAFKLKNKKAGLKIAETYSLLGEPYKAAEFLKYYLKSHDKMLQSEIKKIPAFSKMENTKAWVDLWKEKYYSGYETKLDEARYAAFTKEDYALAFDIADKLIIRNPKRHKAYELRGDIFMKQKDYKSAANSYKKAAELKKRNAIYKTKAANALYLAGKYKQAAGIYDAIIKDKFYNPQILLNKAQNETALKKYKLASQDLNLFLSYFPENPRALYLAGKLNQINGEYINALENYNNAIKKDGSKPEYFISCADTYLQTKTYESAIKNYSMALDLNPKLPEVWYKKGIAELKSYKYKEGCEDLKKAKFLKYNKADDYIIKYCK